MTKVARWMGLVSVALASAGCQLVAPLPDADGGGASSTETGTASTASGVSSASGGPVTSASGGPSPCGESTCDNYCGAVMDSCEAHPQYRSAANCCSVCLALGSDVTCRTLPTDGADGPHCSAAGVLGPLGGAQCGGCADMCNLFAQACGSTQTAAVSSCTQQCLNINYNFDACAKLTHDDIDCRLQDILRAFDATGPARDMACKDAADKKCDPKPCE